MAKFNFQKFLSWLVAIAALNLGLVSLLGFDLVGLITGFIPSMTTTVTQVFNIGAGIGGGWMLAKMLKIMK